MIRFGLVIIVKAWGICALLCLVMAFSTRTQLILPFIPGIGICDGKPCYRDILPGKTGWGEAQTLLERFPEVKKFGASNYANLPDFQGTLLLIPNADNLTEEIALAPSENFTYVGSAFLQLGVPCAAVRLGRDDIGLFYPGISIVSRMEKIGAYFVLRPTSPITRVILSPQVETCSDIGLDRTQADFRWHGFVRYVESGG